MNKSFTIPGVKVQTLVLGERRQKTLAWVIEVGQLFEGVVMTSCIIASFRDTGSANAFTQRFRA